MSGRTTESASTLRHRPARKRSFEAGTSSPSTNPSEALSTHPIRESSSSSLQPILEQQRRRFDSLFGATIADGVVSLSPQRLPPSIRGVVAGSPQSPLGFALALDAGRRPVITNLWATGDPETQGTTAGALIDALLAGGRDADGLAEAQDLVFGASDLSAVLARHAVEQHARLFLEHTGPPTAVDETGPVIVRRYRPGDLLSIATLIQRAFHDSLDAHLNSEYSTLSGCLRRTSAAVSGVAWGPLLADSSLVAHEAGSKRLVGCLLMTDLGGAHAHIVDVAVSPERTGRGIGRLLLAGSLTRARRQGIRRVSLCVSPGNRGAFSLYRRCGFVVRRKFNAFLLQGTPAAARSTREEHRLLQ